MDHHNISADNNSSPPASAKSQLWTVDEDDCRVLVMPSFEYESLNHDNDEQRFLTLYPCDGDKNAEANHVRCKLETLPLFDVGPFIAVKNTRGYRKIQSAIEINECALILPAALEIFLRHFRRNDAPVRLWIRHICLQEYDPDEKARYWNRDFVDTIYAMATKVADMCDFNNDLVNSKTVKKVHDSRYINWEKEWYSRPEEVTLPSVYPIRLGAKLSKDKPTDEYQYVPLDVVANEIRVIVLQPAEDRNAPIQAIMAHCPVHCEVDYSALSYRWGDDLSTEEISLSGQRFHVRKGLAEALRSIRMTDRAVPLWVDAICINQDDLLEKNGHIPRMGDVYDRAGMVLSYTGPATDDVGLAIELAAELKMPMMRYNDSSEWHFGEWGSKDEAEGGGLWFGPNRIGPERLAKMVAALYKLACRSYFRRAWVLQEIAAASNPTVKTGHKYDVLFDQMDRAMQHLTDMLRNDPSLAGKMLKADPTIETVDTQELAFVRKLYYFRHINAGGVHPLFGAAVGSMRPGAPSCLETLVLARDFESSDPRDKIYALWNLAQDKDGLDFQVDYQKSVPQVYGDFARAWALQHGSLDILGAVECRRPETELYKGAPSWVPDWSLPSASSCLVRRDRIPPENMSYMRDLEGPLYWADGGNLARDVIDSPLFTFEGDILHCAGVILDTIHHIFQDPPEITDWQRFPHCDLLTHHAYHHWISEMCAHYVINNLTTYQSTKQAATAMFHGDCIAVWPHRSQNPENVDKRWAREEEYVCRVDRNSWSQEPKTEPVPRHIQYYAGSYDRTDAFDVVKSVTRGRRPFVSSSGYMGLMPSMVEGIQEVDQLTQKKWHLAVVATCSVPLLLQEQDDGSYKVCGTCFVQGWMEGEVLTTSFGAETTREFWAALAEGEKLRLV